MRILTAGIMIVLVPILLSCDQRQAMSDVDPALGRACFESRRAALPPGTQYEGIESATGQMITIRIMDGLNVKTLDCALKPDGTLQGMGE
jgi:hypothetical protein